MTLGNSEWAVLAIELTSKKLLKSEVVGKGSKTSEARGPTKSGVNTVLLLELALKANRS